MRTSRTRSGRRRMAAGHRRTPPSARGDVRFLSFSLPLPLSLVSLVMFKAKVDTTMLLLKHVCETLHGTRRELFSHWSRYVLRVQNSLVIALKKRSLSLLFFSLDRIRSKIPNPQSTINATSLSASSLTILISVILNDKRKLYSEACGSSRRPTSRRTCSREALRPSRPRAYSG